MAKDLKFCQRGKISPNLVTLYEPSCVTEDCMLDTWMLLSGVRFHERALVTPVGLLKFTDQIPNSNKRLKLGIEPTKIPNIIYLQKYLF